MTYKELKLATMQKMFHDITTLTEDTVTKPYLDKMAYVTNCAIQRACAVGGGLKKHITVSRISFPNIIEGYKRYYKPYVVADEDVTLFAKCGRAYSFNVCGKGSAVIYIGNTLYKTVSFDSPDMFSNFRGIIENNSNSSVKIVFLKNTPYIISYPAVYDVLFNSDEDVCESNDYIYYNMRKLANDFYRFDSENSIVEKSNKEGISYKIIDEETVAIEADASGVWDIPYCAYPAVITEETSDNEEIKLPYEVCLIQPLYIASELNMEDKSGKSISWRNKFESSLSEYAYLKKQGAKRKYEVVSTSGGLYDEI